MTLNELLCWQHKNLAELAFKLLEENVVLRGGAPKPPMSEQLELLFEVPNGTPD